MSSIGIAELTALGAAPASGDLFVVVDISDTSQSLAGSTKNLTIANLFTSPTMTGTTTVSVLSVGSTANVVGNFSVATNKFTVVAASGNTAIAGTLGVTGASTFASISATSGAFSADVNTSASGNFFWSGRSILKSPADNIIELLNSTGTGFSQLQFGGTTSSFPSWKRSGAGLIAQLADDSATTTITGSRHIGGTDIASAIAPGTFSDGTAPANNAYSSANVFSLLVSKTVSATTGSVVTSEVYHKQTGANAAGSTIAAFSYIDSAHTSGTTLINIANVASVEATGNGGTTTTLGCYRTQALIGTGATVTALPLFDARPPANSGTIGTAYAFRSGAMDTASVNWGIYLGSSTTSGGSTFRDTALATGATVGHLFIPSCAGTPTGVPSNIPTGQIAMQFDSTNNFLYAYLNGAWKKTTVFA